MEAPHVVPLDAIGAAQIARLEALIEAIDGEIASSGLTSGRKVKALADLELRAIRRQMELLDRYGLTPRGRAEFVRELVAGETIAEALRRRRDGEAA